MLRGGAFNNNARNVRCAYRNRNNPNNLNRNNGFRVVVVAHDFPILPEMPGGAGFPAEALKKAGAARSWPHARSIGTRVGRIGVGPPPGFRPWGGPQSPFGMVHRPSENCQARGGFVIQRIVEQCFATPDYKSGGSKG